MLYTEVMGPDAAIAFVQERLHTMLANGFSTQQAVENLHAEAATYADRYGPSGFDPDLALATGAHMVLYVIEHRLF